MLSLKSNVYFTLKTFQFELASSFNDRMLTVATVLADVAIEEINVST